MYIALEGSGVLELESGEHFPLERDSLIRVGPAERRRVPWEGWHEGALHDHQSEPTSLATVPVLRTGD